MTTLSRGWLFLQQAWKMALADRDLIKPSIYAMIVGLVISVVGIIPLVGAALLFGDSGFFGRGVIILIGAILIFTNYVVSYVFSGMTVYLIYGYLAEGDGRMDKAWTKVQAEFWSIVSLAAASTVVSVLTSQLRRAGGRRAGASVLGGGLAGVVDSVWTEAAYLILPAMMIEDANLATGVKRATQIAKGNLLLIGVSTVGVRWITRVISLLLGGLGLVLGLGLALALISIFNSAFVALVVGIGLGAMIFFSSVVVANVVSSYTMTAYNTCLFLWARDVEKAQLQAKPLQVTAPAPLAAALAS